LSWAYSYLAGDRSLQLKEVNEAVADLRRASELAETEFAQSPNELNALLAIVSARYQLGVTLKMNGDMRASLQPLKACSATANEYNRHELHGYLFRKEWDCLVELADSFQEIGKPDQTLKALREAIAVRDRWDMKNPDRNATHHRLARIHFFTLAGHLFARLGRTADVAKAFEQANAVVRQMPDEDLALPESLRYQILLHLNIGDYYAGLKLCNATRRRDHYPFTEPNYCPPVSSPFIKTPDSRRKAVEAYQKVVNLSSEMESRTTLVTIDNELRRLALEKLSMLERP
jgi:tetratricopeptide (TPR) repeat protein